MVNFSSDSNSFSETSCTSWKNHEFLESKFVSCMFSSVNDVEGRSWHLELMIGLMGKLGKMLEEWLSS